MNYILFDLEFNQAYPCKKENKENKEKVASTCPFEIIQIGAIKLNEKLETISTFDKFVKPELYPELHPFVKDLTGITADVLEIAESFKKIYKEFLQFITDDPSVLIVWGMTDLNELFRNIAHHGVNALNLPQEYINLQRYASSYLNCPKGTNVGLQTAVEVLHIPLQDSFHNALNDAYYTAEIFKILFTEKMEPLLYTPHKYRSLDASKSRKQKVDRDLLLKQFEKMFHREMSEEEKSIILLAYNMGKSHQFIVNKEVL